MVLFRFCLWHCYTTKIQNIIIYSYYIIQRLLIYIRFIFFYLKSNLYLDIKAIFIGELFFCSVSLRCYVFLCTFQYNFRYAHDNRCFCELNTHRKTTFVVILGFYFHPFGTYNRGLSKHWTNNNAYSKCIFVPPEHTLIKSMENIVLYLHTGICKYRISSTLHTCFLLLNRRKEWKIFWNRITKKFVFVVHKRSFFCHIYLSFTYFNVYKIMKLFERELYFAIIVTYLKIVCVI